MKVENDRQKRLHELMLTAIEEAEGSLREGNSGFGAVIENDGEILARTHDTDSTDGDPTAHAELKAVRAASARIGKNLSGCVLVSTHEPCPMCSAAALWAGIDGIAYGFSIKDALRQGRRRIDFPVGEMYSLAGKPVRIHENILRDRCAILYDRSVRQEIELLRNADDENLRKLGEEKCRRRVQWFREHYAKTIIPSGSLLDDAYRLFLTKLGITEAEAPVVERTADSLVIRSANICPTLEACRILNLNTRVVCRHLTEQATTELLRQLHPGLRFSRNYDKLRPRAEYCEEMISVDH